MGALSLSHILLLAIVALLFFGPRRLPEVGKSIGKAIKGFKEGLNEIDVDSKDIKDQEKIVYKKETEKDKA